MKVKINFKKKNYLSSVYYGAVKPIISYPTEVLDFIKGLLIIILTILIGVSMMVYVTVSIFVVYPILGILGLVEVIKDKGGVDNVKQESV